MRRAAPDGHDFAADSAQLGRMRPFASTRLLAAAACAAALTIAGAAFAQANSDGPLATAGSTAGGVPTADTPPPTRAPAPVKQTPGPTPVQPTADFRDLEAAPGQERRAPLLGDYHGEVGAVVGTNGLRGAYGRIVTHPTENMVLDLRFSTLHENLPYGVVYGPGARYRPGPDALAADPIAPDHGPH